MGDPALGTPRPDCPTSPGAEIQRDTFSSTELNHKTKFDDINLVEEALASPQSDPISSAPEAMSHLSITQKIARIVRNAMHPLNSQGEAAASSLSEHRLEMNERMHQLDQNQSDSAHPGHANSQKTS
jgi:hypothetical protein